MARTDFRNFKFGALREAIPSKAPSLKYRVHGLPEKVDLREHCSPVDHQGKLGSCNACSVVGALEFLAVKRGDFKELSRLFLYYNARRLSRKESEDSGLFSAHAIAGALAFGVCEEVYWPYNIEDFTKEPPQDAYNSAKGIEAVQYARIEGGLDGARAALANGQPLVVGFDIPLGYYSAVDAAGRMPKLGEVADGGAGGHSMLVVGYNTADQTWLVRNSWGVEFGEKGYVHIPNEVLSKYVWSDDLWAIGALEAQPHATLFGVSMKEAIADTRLHAEAQRNAALAKLKGELRSDLQGDADTAKKSIRDRLRGQ